MTAETVLIAALSGRALAAAARRAGYLPLVVDAFGDADTRESAAALHCLEGVTRAGFRCRPLVAALDALAHAAPQPPLGLVLGSGFEDVPKLVAALAARYRLMGNGPEAIARAKDPASFFPLLDALQIPHPETRLAPPQDVTGWLSKRIGASGGAHVVPCTSIKTARGRYFQRRIEGDPVSVLAVAGRQSVRIVGMSRQWSTGAEPRPYRYGGAAGPIHLGAAIEARMITAVEAVTRALGLVGLLSFDFMLADGVSSLLEVNPRPGATLDIFDAPEGSLFRAHLAACRGEKTEPAPQSASGARAAGVLYADPGHLTLGSFPWPHWTADRPRPGTSIPRHRPIATVFADSHTALEAERNCRRRLDELARMLYGRALNRERINAETDRPRPERLGTSGQAR